MPSFAIVRNTLDCLHGADAISLDRRRVRPAILAMLALGMTYGAMMGTYGGFAPHRLLQIAYSAVKVPILFLLTMAICLPSFFVLNTLAGVRDDFREVVKALLTAQVILAVVLASLAPYTLFWYSAFTDHHTAVMFNAAMFTIASLTAQAALLRLYRPLIARRPRHRVLWASWIAIYAFVGMQLGWTLRPFVGSPGLPTQFFRDDSLTNAYVAIARIVLEVLGG